MQATLDGAVQQTSLESARAQLAAGSTPLGTVATQFAAVFADRAQAMTQLRAAVYGYLGMQPIAPANAPPGDTPATTGTTALLSATQATNRIAAAGALLTRSDTLYRSVRRSLAAAAGHGTLPPSAWVTNPQVWQLGSVAAQVDLLATSPTLAATHYVVLRTVRLSPPALPTPPGAPANVSVISPTSQIGVTVVLANQGSSNEPHVSVRFSLTDQTSGATTSQDPDDLTRPRRLGHPSRRDLAREAVHLLSPHRPGDPPCRPDAHGRHGDPGAAADRPRLVSRDQRTSRVTRVSTPPVGGPRIVTHRIQELEGSSRGREHHDH